jgi:hypothetical protein
MVWIPLDVLWLEGLLMLSLGILQLDVHIWQGIALRCLRTPVKPSHCATRAYIYSPIVIVSSSRHPTAHSHLISSRQTLLQAAPKQHNHELEPHSIQHLARSCAFKFKQNVHLLIRSQRLRFRIHHQARLSLLNQGKEAQLARADKESLPQS